MDNNQPPLSGSAIRKRVRMRDVASRAGVSVSTVSLVLSGDARIPEDTTRKVLQTVKAMEYRPNIIARNLARKGSRTIGVILPEQAFIKNQSYYFQVLHGIHNQTQPAGYKILIEAANKMFLERRYYHRLLKEQSADGIIYMAATLSDVFLSDMTREPMPFVLLGGTVDDVSLPVVQPDERLAVQMAVRHLASLGHKTIGYVGGPTNLSSGRNREQGFLLGLEEAGLPGAPENRVNGEFGTDEAASAALALLNQKITALVVAGDQMAYGVLKACRQAGRRVPEDVALVGIDDLSPSSWVSPALTTVRLHIEELGSLAARFIVKNVKNPQANKVAVDGIPAPQLIIRETCGGK